MSYIFFQEQGRGAAMEHRSLPAVILKCALARSLTGRHAAYEPGLTESLSYLPKPQVSLNRVQPLVQRSPFLVLGVPANCVSVLARAFLEE